MPEDDKKTDEVKPEPAPADNSADIDVASEASDSPIASDAPADALSRTPEDLNEQAEQEAAESNKAEPDPTKSDIKKPGLIKRFYRKTNIYLLAFLLLVVIAAIVTVVTYLNSQQSPTAPNVANQPLSEEALKDLANSNVAVGDASQSLTIKGSAVINGQTLLRGDLSVADDLQAAGTIQAPSITISGDSNLGDTQAQSLQVAGNAAVQGSTTLRDLSVSGTSTFNGAMTVSQITASKLIMSGNGQLEVPNHLSFTGPTPSRELNSTVLGQGGSVSVSGSDTSGTIRINTGNNPKPGCFMRINFRQAFPATPHVLVGPVAAAAGNLNYFVKRDTNGFSLCTANTPQGGATFAFDYFVMG